MIFWSCLAGSKKLIGNECNFPYRFDALVHGLWRSGRVEACLGDEGNRIDARDGLTNVYYT